MNVAATEEYPARYPDAHGFVEREPVRGSTGSGTAADRQRSSCFRPGRSCTRAPGSARSRTSPGTAPSSRPRPGVQLYPTLEVAPVTPRTDAYLAHAPIPVQFTEEDFDQVVSGNFVTKVIYLPDPEFQELALAGVETLVSTRLDPGVDPIAEADRRGSILAIVRIGSKDLKSAPVQPEASEAIVPACWHEGSRPSPATNHVKHAPLATAKRLSTNRRKTWLRVRSRKLSM